MRHILFTILSLALLFGCTKSGLVGGGMTADPIIFGGSIDVASSGGNMSPSIFGACALTRIGQSDVQFSDADMIKVFGYRAASSGPTTSFASPFLSNADFTYSTVTGNFTSSSSDAYWQLGQAHNFFGFYPSTLVASVSGSSITAPLVVSPASGISDDVMIAGAQTLVYGGGGTLAAFNFSHVLSKVKFRIKREADASASDLTSIEFSSPSASGTVDLTTGVVSKTAGSVVLSNTFAPLTITATEQAVPGEWLVMPGDLLNDIILTIGDKRMKLVNAGSTATTSPGKINVITVTVKKSALTFTLDIAPWTDAPVSDVADNGPYNLSVDKGNVEILSSGSFTYTTTHTGGATVAKGDQAWLTVTSGNASPVTFTATNNTEPAPRQGTITITAGRIAKQVNIIQLAPPKIGDYFYSDNTFSEAFDANKTLLGIIYRVERDGYSGMLIDVSAPEQPRLYWSTVFEVTGASDKYNGVTNMNAIKKITNWKTNYPLFTYCDARNTGGINTGWYLPAVYELEAYYAGCCGLRLVKSGAIDGEINIWRDDYEMPGWDNAVYIERREEFNAKLLAAGGIRYDETPLESSSEASDAKAWRFSPNMGVAYKDDDKSYGFARRCVRAFTLQEPS